MSPYNGLLHANH